MIRKILTLAAFAASLAVPAIAGVEKQGRFNGASGHTTSGGVQIVQDAEGYAVQLGPQFSLDGGPDPKVGFGINGEFVEGSLIGELKSLTGSQTYRVPAGLDVSGFTDVFIWCEQFSVPLGVAAVE